MRRSAAVLALTTFLVILPGSAPAQVVEQQTTDSLGQLQIWTVNIHLFEEQHLKSGRWKKFIDRITKPNIQRYMPDIVLVQEITRGHADNFAKYLARKAGASYAWRHTKTASTRASGGVWKMVVWRTGRLEPATGSKNDVLRWAELRLNEDSGKCEIDGDRLSIGVRLKDKVLNENVTAGSVHWTPHPKPSASACVIGNTRRAERLLEKKWPRRPLTIIGGDFNNVPDDGDTPNDGREIDPSCWYRHVFGMYEADDQTTTCSDKSPLSYYDAVYLSHSNSDGTTQESICHQWTHARSKGPAGSHACQDSDSDDDTVRDKSRIDYLWLRWETLDGEVEKPSLASARARVPYAGADQINWAKTTPYSDHRAVGARVQV